MKNRIGFLLLSALISFAFSLHAKAAGGTSAGGGGGGVYKIGDQYRLIDLYNSPELPDFLRQRYLNIRPSTVESTQNFHFDQNQIEAFQRAAEILTAWTTVPYDTVGNFILLSMRSKQLTWNFTTSPVSSYHHFQPQYGPSGTPIETFAYYHPTSGSHHVDVDLNFWNAMPAEDQVGAVVHETLRRVQIYLNSTAFDDEALQKATALVMACPARVRNNQILFSILGGQKEVSTKIHGSFEAVIHACIQGT